MSEVPMTILGHTVVMLLAAGLFSAAVPVGAQGKDPGTAPQWLGAGIRESGAPEVLIHIGAFGAGSDEGHIGTGTSYGGTVEVPFRGRLAFSVDAQTTRIVIPIFGSVGLPLDDWYRTRRNLVMPGAVVRFGRQRAHGYFGGGIAGEWDTSTYHHELGPGDDPRSVQGWTALRPGVYELTQSEARGLKPFCKLGVSVFPLPRVGVRADIYGVGWHLGARLGVGYRFGS
jgi:hypothetical protein